MPTPPAFRILTGVPTALQGAAARLYWRQFGHLLQPLPTRPARGVALVRALMRPDLGLVALAPSGRLVGMAGLVDGRGAFLEGRAAGYADAFGPVAGRLRALCARLYRGGPATTDLVIQGCAVAPGWRRRGVARALAAAAETHARARGHPALRVEVEAGNKLGLAVWQAMGFRPVARQRLGWPWSPPAHVLRRPVQEAAG